MKPGAPLFVLPLVLLGCAASTPPANQPQPAPTAPVTVVDLNAKDAKAPSAPAPQKDSPSPADARKKAEEFGLIGLLNAGVEGAGADAGQESASKQDQGATSLSNVLGGPAQGKMFGDQVGDSFGVGGLGLVGVGTGGGGTGEGIGLGSVGTPGRGAGGTKSPASPKMVTGATTAGPGLPPEVIQRIVRQNFGRFRLCYEQGLKTNPKLGGKVSIRFVIAKDGSVSSVGNSGSDLSDSGVVNCVARAFSGLSFPQPDGGASVSVVYPINFSPGDDATDPKKAAAAPPPASKPAPAPPRRPSGVDLDDKP